MLCRQTFRVLMGGAIVAGASLGAVALDLGCSRGGTAATTAPGGLPQLEADTGIKWKLITYDRGARTYPLGTPSVALAPGSEPGAAAVAFFAKYGGIWGIVDANEELLLDGSSTLAGRKYASFLQSEGGVAVDDTRFSISFDDAGHIKGVSGNFFPNLHGFPTKPALTPEQAVAAAEADMEKTLPAGATLDPRYAPKPHLLILPGTYPALPAPTLSYFLALSYTFDAGSEAHGEADAIYYVDASSGAILSSASEVQEQYTGTNVAAVTGTGQGEIPTTPTRSFNVLATSDAGAGQARSLNEDERRKELAEDKARAKDREQEDRAARAAEPRSYDITVESASVDGLPPPVVYATTDAPAKAQGVPDEDSSLSQPPAAGADATLDEAVRILADYVSLLGA